VAQVLKFRRGATDTNLLNTSGFHLLDPGWIPKVAVADEGVLPPPLEEVLRVEANYSSQDNLAAALIALNKVRQDAWRYIVDRTEGTPVWFHDKLNSETGERRALTRKISIKELTEPHGVGPEGSMIDAHPHYEIGFEREPYWERTAAVSMPTATPAAGASVVYDYTASPGADVVGEAPARIGRLTVEPTTGSSSLGKLWIGLRSANRHGTLANFANIWECEDGGPVTDAALATDATASPGGGGNTKITVTPGTATWAKRWYMYLATAAGTGNEVDNYGEFLWLLRCKVSSGTWEIQLRWGYSGMDDDDRVPGPIREVSSTSWDYVDGGYCPIPLRSLKAFPTGTLSSNFDMLYVVNIWARRTSGSGTLDLDCVCPVPLDEGWMRAWDFSASESPRQRFEFAESPHGICQGLVASATPSIPEFMPYASDRFRLPVGDGRMIIVYARQTSSVLTDAVRLCLSGNDGTYYPRWYQLRGSE